MSKIERNWQRILDDLDRTCSMPGRDDDRFNPSDEARAVVAALMAVRQSVRAGHGMLASMFVWVLLLQALTVVVLALG